MTAITEVLKGEISATSTVGPTDEPQGDLFKDAEAIEIMRKVDTLVVDKTGTLTEGNALRLRRLKV